MGAYNNEKLSLRDVCLMSLDTTPGPLSSFGGVSTPAPASEVIMEGAGP